MLLTVCAYLELLTKCLGAKAAHDDSSVATIRAKEAKRRKAACMVGSRKPEMARRSALGVTPWGSEWNATSREGKRRRT